MAKKKEIWAKVDEGGFYDGLYEISSWGRWKILPRLLITGKYKTGMRLTKEKITNGSPSHGYRTVQMKKDWVKKQQDLHIFVGTYFVPNPDNHPFVLHKDDNRSNNYYENLEWGTQMENVSQMMTRGRHRTTKGVERTNCKLTEEDIRQIRKLYSSGAHTYRSLGELYSVSFSHIDDIVNFKRWKHVS